VPVGLTNLAIGVLAAGYSVLEEIPLLLLNVAVLVAVSVAVWRLLPAPRR
jgi:hypothetical protein